MFAKNRARDSIEDMLITPFFRKEAKYIGIELEFPILFPNSSLSSKEIGVEFLTSLISAGEFEEEPATCSAVVMRVNNDAGDSISYDYSYATIEFSMSKGLCIQEIAKRFYRYFDIAFEFYASKGCIISGMGSNPMMPDVIEYTDSNYTNTLRNFIENFCPQKDPKYYLTNMQSVQTHIEVPGNNLVEKFNTLCMYDFIRGLLLSNSLPEPSNLPSGVEYADGTLCARDLNWEGSGFPNTGICSDELSSLDALIDYFTDKELCFKQDGLSFECFKPILLKEYFNQQEKVDNINGYFNVERVTINRYNVLEVRGDCIQPLSDTFSASAFSIGICNNSKKAYELCRDFLADNRLSHMNNRELRKVAITGKFTELVPSKTLSTFLYNALEASKEGLLSRGYGEEDYLTPLYDRATTLKNPAIKQQMLLNEGKDILLIAKENSVYGR